jgi:hypothetical protein
LQEAKAIGGGHKRNKSESNLKNHLKKLSMDDFEMSGKNHARKSSKIIKKGDEFFEF